MRAAAGWRDYELLDAAGGERLERFGEIILIRPDPQVLWKTEKTHPLWKKAHGHYLRSSTGGGHWESLRPIPESWMIEYGDLRLNLKPMNFKHTGVFPEQAVNWDYMSEMIKARGESVTVLNLFAYTGAATLVCLKAGARVTHVDASKGMVQWAKENAVSSGLAERPVRWLVDDCFKFVQREIRRGNRYDAVVMDPPSYGRGPGGEIWKLEESIYDFIGLSAQLLSDKPLFFMVNSYTAGLAPSVMKYMLSVLIKIKPSGRVWADEIGLPVGDTGLVLPCGSTAAWQAENGKVT